jgi:hypothetical protein
VTTPLDSLRLIIFAVATAVLIGLGAWAYQHVKGIGDAEARAELQPKIDALTIERNNALTRLAEVEADRAKAEKASRDYQTELAGLRDAPVRHDPVRLCVEPAARPVARAPQAPAATRLNGSAAAAGVVPDGARADLVPGPDIGPELRALLLRADEVTSQARGLQSYCAD